jgi:hypothetical protein
MIGPHLRQRLAALKANGTIAGWQEGGGPNAGLSPAPLPALVFPSNGGGASTYYNAADLAVAVTTLEKFGPLQLTGRR